ncbi:MAG: bifunctional precorrin-2 dehydrogenase/sirohydrochlorin ferrochelatase [Elusimicrobia bacterium]|nr:bifunctional precorrin-2 dehydrogenase/sirohydrochlorin ferrochelatase [Elusimicrobiota bacterium]
MTVIAPDPAEKIEYFAKKGRLTLHKREYKSPEASQYSLVISATSERRVNQTAAQDAKEAGVLVNVTDDPVLCDFVFPAVLKRGSLSVAVSTDGKSPFLAGHLRAILEDIFPEHWNQIAEAAALFREKVRRLHPRAPAKQAACYEKFIRVDWKKLLQDKSGPVLSKIFEDLVQ